MKKSKYWQCIRDIAQADDSIEPSSACVEAALNIFQPEEKLVRFFQLKPAFSGMVRRTSSSQTLVYELDEEHFVRMEQSSESEGVRLAGFASGVDDQEVLLFGEETVFQANVCDGEFEFNSLPFGCYDMAFVSEGESLWIPDLKLEENGK